LEHFQSTYGGGARQLSVERIAVGGNRFGIREELCFNRSLLQEFQYGFCGAFGGMKMVCIRPLQQLSNGR
jgi:hypothetical protein